MLLAERAGRKLERWSNPAPRGMAVIAQGCKTVRRNKIRPIGLLHFFRLRPQCAVFLRRDLIFRRAFSLVFPA